MDIQVKIEEAAPSSALEATQLPIELSNFDLAIVGGGCGEVVFG